MRGGEGDHSPPAQLQSCASTRGRVDKGVPARCGGVCVCARAYMTCAKINKHRVQPLPDIGGLSTSIQTVARPWRVARVCLTGVPVAHLVRLPVPHQVGAVVVKDRGDILAWEGVGRQRNQEAGLPHRSVPNQNHLQSVHGWSSTRQCNQVMQQRDCKCGSRVPTVRSVFVRSFCH